MSGAVHLATISCRRFNVSIGQVDEHAGKNSIFLPDELLNHLGDGRPSEKNPFPFYLLSLLGHWLAGHQKKKTAKGRGGVRRDRGVRMYRCRREGDKTREEVVEHNSERGKKSQQGCNCVTGSII